MSKRLTSPTAETWSRVTHSYVTQELSTGEGSFSDISLSFYLAIGEHADEALGEHEPNVIETLEPWTVGYTQIVVLAELLAHTGIGEGD